MASPPSTASPETNTTTTADKGKAVELRDLDTTSSKAAAAAQQSESSQNIHPPVMESEGSNLLADVMNAGGADTSEKSRDITTTSNPMDTSHEAISSSPSNDIPAESSTSSSPLQTDTINTTPPATSDNNSHAAGPICTITLLLTSGARHPYKLDEKYLNKRNVEIPGCVAETGRKDPFSISVYTLKELILREWREEWEGRPSSPTSIRLIHFGRLLEDKMALRECRFNTDSPNVVHMTVRPQEVVDEEDASKGKAMGRDGTGSERTAGCRCVIM